MIKTTNSIWTDFKNILEKALLFYNVQGWSIVQNYNPVKGNWPKPVLLMRRVRSAQYAAQGQKYINSPQTLILQTQQAMELTFQIDALCSRVPGNTQDLLASDIIVLLANYFTGPFGTQALREKGYSLAEKIHAMEEPDFTDENDVFEFNPFLQMKLFYINTKDNEVPTLSALEPEGIKGV